MSFKHNKKRNTGLTYEFLVRSMSEGLIESNSKLYNKSLDLIKKYYFKSAPLEKERQLFTAILENRDVTERVATNILKEVMNEAKKLDFKLNDIKKSNLIKESHKNFGKDFFSRYRLDDYKAYASIQLFINFCSDKRTLIESTNKIRLEESLINFMCLKTDKIVESNEFNISDDLTYRLAVKNFNNSYKDELSPSQKVILKEYLIYKASDDKSNFRSFLANEKKNIMKSLCGYHTDDDNMRKKLDEVRNKLALVDVTSLTDQSVEEIMLYRHLTEEIESDE